jgi:hypothetical protein
MASPSAWVSKSPSHEVTDSLGGRSQQRRVVIAQDQGTTRRSLPKWNSKVRPLGLKRNPGRGPGLSPSLAVPAITLMVPFRAKSGGGSQMGGSGTRGGMSVLASFTARGRSLAKGPDERSGPRP